VVKMVSLILWKFYHNKIHFKEKSEGEQAQKWGLTSSSAWASENSAQDQQVKEPLQPSRGLEAYASGRCISLGPASPAAPAGHCGYMTESKQNHRTAEGGLLSF
jgi:hypothetical protein